MEQIDQQELANHLRVYTWTFEFDPEDGYVDIPGLSIPRRNLRDLMFDADMSGFTLASKDDDWTKEPYQVGYQGQTDVVTSEGPGRMDSIVYETADTAWDALSWAFRFFKKGDDQAHVVHSTAADKIGVTLMIFYFD